VRDIGKGTKVKSDVTLSSVSKSINSRKDGLPPKVADAFKEIQRRYNNILVYNKTRNNTLQLKSRREGERKFRHIGVLHADDTFIEKHRTISHVAQTISAMPPAARETFNRLRAEHEGSLSIQIRKNGTFYITLYDKNTHKLYCLGSISPDGKFRPKKKVGLKDEANSLLRKD
jgi:hypothetical protein